MATICGSPSGLTLLGAHPWTLFSRRIRKAAEKAEVFGCPVEEAAKVLTLGINARMAEQAGRQAAIKKDEQSEADPPATAG